MSHVSPKGPTIRLGLRANWQQFALLVLVNAFVGAMVGLERTIVPLIAEQEFGLASRTVILSFIVSFGIVKALANLMAGGLGDRLGRKRVLLLGWIVGLPIPFLLIWAPSWGWVLFANLLLGFNQGLCWSATVIMKIDLVGPHQRGLAMGLNEFAGYLAVSLSALATGYVASVYALRPHPFYLGIVFVVAGLLLSLFFVQETQAHARHEAATFEHSSTTARPSFREIFWLTSWRHRTLFAVSQAGMVNNLNDGMVWGLLPLFLATAGLSVERIGVVAAVYPGVWGIGQLFTGALSDRWGRKPMIVAGLVIQALGIGLVVFVQTFTLWVVAAALMGGGTALVYPTLLASVSDVAHPEWRGSAVGVYRLWRDSGYAVGALLSGVLADFLSISWAILVIAGITAASAAVVVRQMQETLRSP